MSRRAAAALLAVLLADAALLPPPASAARQPDGTAAPPPVADLVARLQARYDGIDDLSAEFEHRYAGGVLRTTDVEQGTMYVKKPGRWRFDYAHPEVKQFVCDGRTIHAYFPADRQVMVSPAAADAGASTPAAFLAGAGSLTRDFTARYADDPAPRAGAWAVRLTPVRPDAAYETLVLTVDARTLDLIALATTDLQGGVSTYRFANLAYNRGLDDAVFRFDIPGGVEVMTDDRFTR